MNRARYVALLRGINVGGHRKIQKDELTAIFSGCGFTDVKTLLASGNVIFATEESDEASLTAAIESALEGTLGCRVDVMVRSIDYIREMVDRDPFTGYDIAGKKFYVTFLSQPPISVPTDLPRALPDQNSIAVEVGEREIFTIALKGVDGRYGDFGKFANEVLGKQAVTTRNWNTVRKILGD
ncbi:MAG: DUF1697 domain-containing protein [Chloroflexota bacterium]|nr:DUF1697 domain-containing protein [Chloroflexota bacterium]